MFSLSMRYAWPAIQCVMFYLLVGGGGGGCYITVVTRVDCTCLQHTEAGINPLPTEIWY